MVNITKFVRLELLVNAKLLDSIQLGSHKTLEMFPCKNLPGSHYNAKLKSMHSVQVDFIRVFEMTEIFFTLIISNIGGTLEHNRTFMIIYVND